MSAFSQSANSWFIYFSFESLSFFTNLYPNFNHSLPEPQLLAILTLIVHHLNPNCLQFDFILLATNTLTLLYFHSKSISHTDPNLKFIPLNLEKAVTIECSQIGVPETA